MSCGEFSDVDCSAVLDRVQEYLHSEMDELDLTRIHEHLVDCGPCLSEYGLEQLVRELIHRSCTCTPAPEHLRMAIETRLVQLRSEGLGLPS
jgi:mycothiol system anti-sigma-R factor